MNWKEIKSFKPKIPSLSPTLLPSEIGEYLIDASKRMGVPLESMAISSLVGLSSLVGRKIAIYPDAHGEDWSEHANLWGLIIGRPSLKKSSTIEQAIVPLLSWERSKHNQLQRVRSKLSKKIATIGDNLEELKLSKDEDDKIDYLINLKRLNRYQRLLKSLWAKSYVANDATYSALLKILEKNQEGILVFRDEIGGWFRQLKRPDRAAERYLYLEGWRGKTSRRNQTERSNIYLEAVCMGVLGATHPATMEAYIRDMQGGIFNDGLINRFSLIIYPDSEFIVREKVAPNFEAKKIYDDVFNYFKSFRLSKGGLHFSSDAQELFNSWEEGLQKKFFSSNHYPVLLEFHLSKYPKTFCALSLIFEKIFEFRNKRVSKKISLEAAELAKKWCDYLELHAKKLFGLEDYKASPEVKELIKRIDYGHIVSGMSIRDIQRIDTPLLNQSDTIKKALAELERKNWLKVHYTGRQGKVELNPKIEETNLEF